MAFVKVFLSPIFDTHKVRLKNKQVAYVILSTKIIKQVDQVGNYSSRYLGRVSSYISNYRIEITLGCCDISYIMFWTIEKRNVIEIQVFIY